MQHTELLAQRAAKEAPMAGSRAEDDDLSGRAVDLILAGSAGARKRRRMLGTPGQPASERTVASSRLFRDQDIELTLERYFMSLPALCLRDLLSQLRSTLLLPGEVKDVVKQLASYFRWASMSGASHTVDGLPLQPLASEFATLLSLRLCGDFSPVTGEEKIWPRWRSPDEALGWQRPNCRTADPEIKARNVRIVAMAAQIETLARARDKDRSEEQSETIEKKDEKKRPLVSTQTVRTLAKRFEISQASVRAALKEQNDYLRLCLAIPSHAEGFVVDES